ncbi:hydrophobin 2 [Desarmillaria tabescens]|uniref:Hydrophobin n=1 Tax=Armillaria tabescens TaxID=1929756 RepID=A0AA39JHG5_ARMTA|nr:hydrophobin 2 [Desarmillaria tabescens]KAK0442718.1 hydrophobin 2 [Desarmillaria tabescens]
MFARLSSFVLLALPLLATATAILPRDDGAACSATGNAQCCDSTQSPTDLDSGVQTLLGLLGVVIGDLTGDVGVTCTPITVLGVGGTECNNQVVCCDDSNFNGLVALGCTPFNIGL